MALNGTSFLGKSQRLPHWQAPESPGAVTRNDSAPG